MGLCDSLRLEERALSVSTETETSQMFLKLPFCPGSFKYLEMGQQPHRGMWYCRRCVYYDNSLDRSIIYYSRLYLERFNLCIVQLYSLLVQQL